MLELLHALSAGDSASSMYGAQTLPHMSLQPETGDKGELKLENKGGLSFFSFHTRTQSQLPVASSKLRTTRCFPSVVVVLRNKGDKKRQPGTPFTGVGLHRRRSLLQSFSSPVKRIRLSSAANEDLHYPVSLCKTEKFSRGSDSN